jgi:hypothetical protein
VTHATRPAAAIANAPSSLPMPSGVFMPT